MGAKADPRLTNRTFQCIRVLAISATTTNSEEGGQPSRGSMAASHTIRGASAAELNVTGQRGLANNE